MLVLFRLHGGVFLHKLAFGIHFEAPFLAVRHDGDFVVPLAVLVVFPAHLGDLSARGLLPDCSLNRLLAMPLTGTPESADERTLLRAERAALISSGQVPSQPDSQPRAQPVESNPASMTQHSTTDAPGGQIVIAPSSSSLPFLEQMTPSERDHYFQELWLQNSSLIAVNLNRSGLGLGRFEMNRRRTNMRPPIRAAMANQPVHRGR